MNAVVIATTPCREDKLKNCLDSLTGIKYPLIVLSDFTYELGKIRFMRDHTDMDQFLLLHDTCQVKKLSFIDDCFAYPHSVSLTDEPRYFGGYLGKYRREILAQVDIPTVTSKAEAIEYEMSWTVDYHAHDLDTKLLFADFGDRSCFELKWGRPMMRIENQYLIKWKSEWNHNRFREVRCQNFG